MRRLHQLDRLLTVAAVIRHFRKGVTLPTVASEVSERMGRRWSAKTIRRDIDLLMTHRYVDYLGTGNWRFRWLREARLLDCNVQERLTGKLGVA